MSAPQTLFFALLFMVGFVTACGADRPETGVWEDDLPLTDGFDFPVGKPDARRYYNAQKFGENNHLGDDWNGTGGGNTDLGDPIYSIASGKVVFAENIGGGWENVIRVVHQVNSSEQVEALYAHCDEIKVQVGDFVQRGQLLGTIGNNRGRYLAHLHLEIRENVGMPIGGGYSRNQRGYLDPTEFINAHRP